jgi:serine/threonine-protein kinase
VQGSRAAAARLEREARLAASLNHRGIVTVFDSGRVEGRRCVVRELIVGRSLARRLADGPMELPEAVDVAAQVAEALAAAHAGGVVHRDLKPQNIMLTNEGRAKVVDFGLSKLTVVPADADEVTKAGNSMTAPHAVLGTAGYMAPEQVAGVAVDARSDQFALGAILYEMLTGRRAFRRETSVQTLAAILEDEPPPVSTLRHDTPPALATIVRRCLAKRPDDRYASTRALARELREARETLAMESRSKQSSRRAAQHPAHRRLWSFLTLVLLAVALGAMIWWQRGAAPAPTDPRVAEIRQIAVLPFVNVSRQAEDQAFADGLVETLTSSLTQLERFRPSLRVVPTSEIRAGRVTGAREALEAFGATLVITGSVQRSESTLRLTLNLVDAAQQVQRASRTVDVAAGTTTAVQDLVVGTVSALLALELEPTQRQAMTAGGTTAPGAYEAFVQARGYLQRFDKGAESVERAIDALNRAIAADPRYALAHASLCEGYWRRYELDRQAQLIEQAVNHCEQALAIDSRLAPVHTTLALVARGRGRYEEAVAVAQRAIELDPTSSDAYRELARAFEALERMADAEATYQKAVAARPDDWLAYNNLGSFFYARGRLPEALAAFGRVTELTPDNTRGHNNLGATLHRMGRTEEATRVWERSMAIRPTFAATSNLGTAYFRD